MSFERVVMELYEGVSGSDALAQAMTSVAGLVRGTGTQYGLARPSGWLATSATGTDPATLAEYLSITANSVLDPRMPYWIAHRNRIATGEEACAIEDLKKTPLKGFLDRVGSSHIAASALDVEGDLLAVVGVMRPKSLGPFRSDEVALLNRILPHVRQVFNLQIRLGALEQAVTSLEATLEQVAAPVFLLGPSGTITHANSAGWVETVHGGWLTQAGRRLRPRVARELPAFEAFLERLLRDVPGGLPVPGLTHRIRDARGVSALLQAYSLRGFPAWGPGQSARVAVFLTGSTEPRVPIPDTLGLTPAEVRLVEVLLKGTSLTDAADALGVTRNTVKTQLEAVFSKTETHTQAQLVRRIAAATALPLREPRGSSSPGF